MKPILSAEVMLNREELYAYHFYALLRSAGKVISGFLVFMLAFCAAVFARCDIAGPLKWYYGLLYLMLFIVLCLIFTGLLVFMAKCAAKENLKTQQPQVITVFNDRITENPLTGRQPPYSETNIPLSKLYMCYETNRLFAFYVTPFSLILLPKRLLSEEEVNAVENVLYFHCGSVFKTYIKRKNNR